MLGLLVSSMDNTIVATTMGTIISEIGGPGQTGVGNIRVHDCRGGRYAYIRQAVGHVRQKEILYFRPWFFIAGSVLCGTARSITQLCVYRAVQGLGGGALMPTAFTIIFDIFPPEQRGRVSGLFGAVFGLSSIFGPLVGAYLTDYFNWRWIFYINVPLGVLSLVLITVYYFESKYHTRQKIDWPGSVLLVISILSLMFALELGDNYDWNSLPVISLSVFFIVFLTVFIFIEKHSENPIIPYGLFKKGFSVQARRPAFFTGPLSLSPRIIYQSLSREFTAALPQTPD